MYAVILVIWTATTTGSTAHAFHEMEIGKYQSVEVCNEAATKREVEKFKCFEKRIPKKC